MRMVGADGAGPLIACLLEIVRRVIEVTDPVIEDREIVERHGEIGVVGSETFATERESLQEERLGGGEVAEIARDDRQVLDRAREVRVARAEAASPHAQHPPVDVARPLWLTDGPEALRQGLAGDRGQWVIGTEPVPTDRERAL